MERRQPRIAHERALTMDRLVTIMWSPQFLSSRRGAEQRGFERRHVIRSRRGLALKIW
jgi:hypothetical protein